MRFPRYAQQHSLQARKKFDLISEGQDFHRAFFPGLQDFSDLEDQST